MQLKRMLGTTNFDKSVRGMDLNATGKNMQMYETNQTAAKDMASSL